MKAGRTVGAIGGGCTAAAVVAELGWPGVSIIVGALLAVLVLIAWVLKDLGRSNRLAMLIRVLREKA
jgi:hypothetical protein